MNHNPPAASLRALLALFALSLAACATPNVSAHTSSPDEIPLRAMLAYYAANQRQPVQSADVPRGPAPVDPYLAMQQAIQLGQLRPPDLVRASNLLESVMKSNHPAAANLAPLARLLHDQYAERLRLEQQGRDAQRRGDELQEKLDALSAIERSLPRPKGSGRK